MLLDAVGRALIVCACAQVCSKSNLHCIANFRSCATCNCQCQGPWHCGFLVCCVLFMQVCLAFQQHCHTLQPAMDMSRRQSGGSAEQPAAVSPCFNLARCVDSNRMARKTGIQDISSAAKADKSGSPKTPSNSNENLRLGELPLQFVILSL